MATKKFDVIVRDANGVPVNTAPTFDYYHVYNSVNLVSPQPTTPMFVAVPNETGRYTFAVSLQAGEYLRAQINKGADPSKYEYLRIEYADLLDLATVLSSLDEAKTATLLAKKILANKISWNATTALMSVYEDDGSTLAARFNFTDENGNPSVTSPLNRTPVALIPVPPVTPPVTPPATQPTGVTLQLLMNGANGSTAFTDTSPLSPTIVNGGDVMISTAQAPTGMSSSGYFPGNSGNSYLTTQSQVLPAIGTADFTFEVYVYLRSLTTRACFFDTRAAGNLPGILFAANEVTGKLSYYGISSDTLWVESSLTVPLNGWHHLCYMRKNGTFYFFLDGVVDPTPRAMPDSWQGIKPTVGMTVERGIYNPRVVDGNMSNLRYTIGTAVYATTGFTPPALPLPSA